jgi:hypothetical protein
VASATILAIAATTLLTSSPAHAEDDPSALVPPPYFLRADVTKTGADLTGAGIVELRLEYAADGFQAIDPDYVTVSVPDGVHLASMEPLPAGAYDYIEYFFFAEQTGTYTVKFDYQDGTDKYVYGAEVALTWVEQGFNDFSLTLSDTYVAIEYPCYGDPVYPEFKAYLTAPGIDIGDIGYTVGTLAYLVEDDPNPRVTVDQDVMPAPVQDGIELVDGWYPVVGGDEYSAYFRAYWPGDYTIIILINDQPVASADITVLEAIPGCFPPAYLSAAVTSGHVTVGEKALVTVTATNEYGEPALYAEPFIWAYAPEGVTVTFAAELEPGVFEYTVEAAQAGTYDITFDPGGFAEGATTVQVTFDAGGGGGLVELFEKILTLIFQLIAELLALLMGGTLA